VNRDSWWRVFFVFLAAFLVLGFGLTWLYLRAPWLLGGGKPPSTRIFLQFYARFVIVAPFVAALAAWVAETAGAAPWVAYMGRWGPPPPVLELSLIRTHLKREEWDQAKAVLDQQWAAHPGNPELLREYERYFLDGLGAPIGAARFFEAQVPVMRGDAREYAFMRLAELHADVLRQPGESRHWCHRLLSEFPASPVAAQISALMDSLPPPPSSK